MQEKKALSSRTRYDGELGEPLMWRQGSQVSMRMARGYIWAPSPLLITTGGSIPLFCLEGVPAFPGASEDPQLSLATRGEDWASQGQPKGKALVPWRFPK